MIYDCLIIGGGPAGIAAAIQLKRAGLRIAIFEKNEIGGLLRNANKVENYLGFDGKSGEKIVEVFVAQLEKHEIEVISEEVLTVTHGFVVKTANAEYESKTVIVATGTKPRKLDIEGVYYEIADLPPLTQPKKFLVIGGGDVAFDYALNLHARGHYVKIRTKVPLKCLSLLIERAVAAGIKYSENEDKDVDYILVAIGRDSNLPEITTISEKGLYFVGDVHNKIYRQVHIATGDALKAAMQIIQDLCS